MKIYDKKTLILSIFLGGGATIWKLSELQKGDTFDLFWVLLFGYLTGKGIYQSVSEKAYNKIKEEQEDEQKQYIRNKAFAKVGKMMGFICYGIILLSGITVFLFPDLDDVILTLFFTGSGLFIAYNLLFLYYIKDCKKNDKLNPK